MGGVREGERRKVYEREDGRDGNREGETVVGRKRMLLLPRVYIFLMPGTVLKWLIVNAPLSCYIVKWINRKVAIAGLVQLSNLISSYNGNKK